MSPFDPSGHVLTNPLLLFPNLLSYNRDGVVLGVSCVRWRDFIKLISGSGAAWPLTPPHAVLDRLRPHYYECLNAETAAFQQVSDLTAIPNNHELVLEAHGDLDTDQLLSGPARQFGQATTSIH